MADRSPYYQFRWYPLDFKVISFIDNTIRLQVECPVGDHRSVNYLRRIFLNETPEVKDCRYVLDNRNEDIYIMILKMSSLVNEWFHLLLEMAKHKLRTIGRILENRSRHRTRHERNETIERIINLNLSWRPDPCFETPLWERGQMEKKRYKILEPLIFEFESG